MFSSCALVRPFVSYQTCEHDILKTSKMTQSGLCGQWDEMISSGVQQVKSKSNLFVSVACIARLYSAED